MIGGQAHDIHGDERRMVSGACVLPQISLKKFGSDRDRGFGCMETELIKET